MIENEPRELTLLYHSGKMDDQKALAFVDSLNGYSIKSIDLAKQKVTSTQLAEIANKMQSRIPDLLDETYAEAHGDNTKTQEGERLKNLEDKELLKVLTANPALIATPMIVLGKKAYKFNSAYELVKKDLGNQGGSLHTANREETNKSS